MDLLDLMPKEDDITIPLFNPNNLEDPMENPDGSQMTVTLCSEDADPFLDARFVAAKGYAELGKDAAPSKVRDINAKMLSEVTIGWKLTLGGEPLEFNQEKAEEIYKKLPWIVAQVFKYLKEQRDFT